MIDVNQIEFCIANARSARCNGCIDNEFSGLVVGVFSLSRIGNSTFIPLLLTALLACSGSGSDTSTSGTPDPILSYQQPDSSVCDSSLAVSGGLLCAIQPSRLNATSRDSFGNNSLADSILGFGHHAIAFPPTGTDIQGVYVHLTGSYGRPYNQASARFGSQSFLEEALSSGFIVLQVAYNNRFSVNVDECGGDPSRLNVDNCSGDVRREKILGIDVSDVSDTPVADSIEFRIVTIVEYLQDQDVVFPVDVVLSGAVNWQVLHVGGHSQGATHALYLSKYFSAGRACLLAGGFDVPDTVPILPVESLADWLLDDNTTVNVERIHALVSVDDDGYDAFIRSFFQLGLERDIHYNEISGAPYADAEGTAITGHGAVLSDPRYQTLRTQACFSD